ncbi:MAG: right-handed parallel beta-helix repeat-containing protein [Armatimonadota bacterium]|nr:right-handed parallel beta-helix repeat-containing protein [Armatimonadota bacterium]MDW8025206.1 right-handed parallel beta-helix repeat-containing protein [Armatimonadota bacterium]
MLPFMICLIFLIMLLLWQGVNLQAQKIAGIPTAIYVSNDGNDSWSGRLPSPNKDKTDGPFATLERARDEIRKLRKYGKLPNGAIAVIVRGGTYYRNGPFELGFEDSGAEKLPILYMAQPGEQVRIVGGAPVKGWKQVEDEKVLSRLDEAVRGKIWQSSLKLCEITEYGTPDSGIELFFNDEPMILARYPNEGFMQIADVVEYDGHQIHGIKGSKIGKFFYEGDRPERWLAEKDPWVHGYWFWDWSDQRHRIAKIDPKNRIIEVAPPYHGYGYRKGQWFYAFNILAEIDEAREWYLDRETGLLYFYPPFTPVEKGNPTVSVANALLRLNNVSYVVFDGFIFEVVRGTAIIITNGEACTVQNCIIRNALGWAVQINGGKRHSVRNCEIYATGGGGIALNGGDRKTLTPAQHIAERNHIHHYARWRRMYQPAIALNGVGNIARNNLIHDAPHQAIAFSGNDHIIEFNEIHNVCLESNDAGAIYSGRDWTWRGTIIRYNFFHNISGFKGRGCMGVYLDDMLCGTVVYGNIFYKVTRAAFIGGGRDNIVENNIFVDCSPAVHVDARALGWASYHVETTMKQRLLAMPYKESPWRERYPELVNILADEPAAPKGNIIRRNICVGGRWLDIEKRAQQYVLVEDNLVGVDPLFVNPSKLDFRLLQESPAFKFGFKPIPVERIGLK